MFHRFTDNADWAEHSNRRKEVVLVLNPSNMFPTNVSKVSLVNARGSGRFAFPLNSRSIADAAPMRILYSSSFNVSLTCSTMDCDQSPGDHRSIEPIPVDHLPGSCPVGMHNACERFRQATNEQTKHYGQCWSLL